MLPSTLWQKELAEVAANRRSLFIKMAFPIVIGGAYLLAAPPSFFTATLITLLATITGCFGTGITLSKARSEGILQRIALTPLSQRRIVLEQLGINSVVDFCQLLPLMFVVAVRFGVYDLRLLALLVALVVAIAAANLLGLITTLFASSPGEVMLYSSLALFPLLYLGGVFSPIGTDAGLRTVIAAVIPFFYLQQALLGIIGGGVAWSAGLVAEASVAAGFVVTLVTALVAARALRFEP